jgi:amino acid adenylation domain-containing protein
MHPGKTNHMNMASIIREAAESYPEKDAIVDGQQRYTFRETERFSTNFATFLLANGIRKGDRIAFCAPKSADVVVAILGCLKCGATYVPVDRKLPKERLLFILNDVSPRFIVSSRAIYEGVAEEVETPVDLLDETSLAEHFRYSSNEDISLPPIAGEDVAYCIYTSGSTGRPKGVLIEHGSVDVFYDALAEVMTIDAGSRCMNTSELHFDVHVMDLFFPLSRGATVHLTRPPVIPNNLLQLLDKERITHFTAVGPVMTLMSEGSLFEKCDLSSLRRVMTGAEIINVETMQKWLRKVPGLSLVNGYGPTEATVICTAYIIDKVEPHRTEFYPIGKPMKRTEVLLQDDEGRIVSEPGVKGELLLGGPQVMKGYWNDERQTNAKIINIEGRRYYKSGDICRWLPDGNLDYIGRVDEEIKLSGFRINLSEIKRVMDATESVREGHPVVAVHPALGKVIAACFISDADEPGEEKIFGHLQSVFKHELPYYMIPSLYFLFDRFPQLSSGKTDKRQILQKVNQRLSGADAGLTRFICREEAISG